MDGLKITFSDVQNAAETIRNCNIRIYELLNSAAYHMKQLDNFWKSDGSTTIQNLFSQFSNQFEIQREIIEQYAKFLDHTIETYQNLENAINSNAGII